MDDQSTQVHVASFADAKQLDATACAAPVGTYRAAETREVRERLIGQGRGQGHGPSYQPWIRIGEFPNRGNSFRVHSPLTGRTHHYLSNLEYRHHLLCEYLGNVADIREQYPIHPITETLALAHELGIAHPEFGGHARTITTDSLLTIDEGETRRPLARSLKYAYDGYAPGTKMAAGRHQQTETSIWSRNSIATI